MKSSERRTLLCITSIVLSGCAPSAPPAAVAPPPPAVAVAVPEAARAEVTAADAGAPADDGAALARRFDAYFTSYAVAADFAGVALVARGDHVLFEKAYGKADVTSGTDDAIGTRFRVASLSKTFTGAAVVMLAERGKVSLDDPLARYFPRFPRAGAITLRQLLDHTSGVGPVTGSDIATKCLSTEEIVARIARAKPLFAPGKDSAYSNEGFFLLAAVVEKASGQPFAAFLDENIFKPLGMSHSGTECLPSSDAARARGHVPTPAGLMPLAREEAAMMGAGAVYSTSHDLLAWLRALRTNEPFAFDAQKYPYGWGKRHYGNHDLVEQTGILAGFTAHIALYGKDDTYAVFLSNVQSGITNRIAKDLHALLFGEGQATTPPEVPTVDAGVASLAPLSGDYAAGPIPTPLRFRIEEGMLASHWGDDPFRMLWSPVGEDELFAREQYARAHFLRDAKGKVTGASVVWDGSEPMAFTRKK